MDSRRWPASSINKPRLVNDDFTLELPIVAYRPPPSPKRKISLLSARIFFTFTPFVHQSSVLYYPFVLLFRLETLSFLLLMQKKNYINSYSGLDVVFKRLCSNKRAAI